MLNHAIRFQAEAGLPFGFRLEVGEDVHARGVDVAEERLARLRLFVHPSEGRVGEFVVNCAHALYGQRAGVLDFLRTHFSKYRVDRGVIFVSSPTVNDAARQKKRSEPWVFRIIGVFWLLFGVQVVQIAEELIKTVDTRQKLIAVAQMVLAELGGRVSQGLQDLGHGRVFEAQSHIRPGSTHFRKAGANR
jgi:hypothetical protein